MMLNQVTSFVDCERAGSSLRGLVRWTTIATVMCQTAAVSATMPPQPGRTQPPPPDFQRFVQHAVSTEKGGLRSKVVRAQAARSRFLQQGDASRLQRAIPRAAVVSGIAQIPVIAVEFANKPAVISRQALQDIYFDGASGTLSDYYDEVSSGNFAVTGTVFDWIKLPEDDAYYAGTSNGLSRGSTTAPDAHTGQLIREALEFAVANRIVDFGLYDNDGPDGQPNTLDDDGFVDFIAFVHSEPGGECIDGGNNVWSHKAEYKYWFESSGEPFQTDVERPGGGYVQINEYTIVPALACDDTPATDEDNGPNGIGVVAHEFGHVFGIPDLYDTDRTWWEPFSQGIGDWSVMATGAWNTPASPAHWDAWSKSHLGWLIPTPLSGPQFGLGIPQVETSGVAFQVPLTKSEYFLLENRQPVGFDSQLRGCGLLIWHVDQAKMLRSIRGNNPNQVESCGSIQAYPGGHWGLALEQADGNCDLERGDCDAALSHCRGDAGDPFPGSSNNRTFNAITNPSSHDYAGVDQGVSVSLISNCAPTMTADIDLFPVPASEPGPADILFILDLTASSAVDLPNIKAQMPAIVARIADTFSSVRFGLATFRDFPFPNVGDIFDYAYGLNLPLQASGTALVNAMQNLAAFGGGDEPEAQYEALYQALTGSGRDLNGDGDTGDIGEIAPQSVGWASGRARVVYLLTGAQFHDSDTESYPPGTLFEAAGRQDVLDELAPRDPFIFTLVSESTGTVVVQGEGTNPVPLQQDLFEQQAVELAIVSSGEVIPAGEESTELLEAIEASLASLELEVSPAPPQDADGDGIPDSSDPCPFQAEDGSPPFPNDGCPAGAISLPALPSKSWFLAALGLMLGAGAVGLSRTQRRNR